MTGEFEFQFPWVLALLGLLPVYALLRGKTGRHSALTFPSAEIARLAGGRARAAAGRFLFFLRLLALALGIVALAGPRLANYHVESETPGIDIMLVLDLSWSMEAIDMGRPADRLTRFACASGVLKDFIAKRPDDRIGLIAFSGQPYLASPLTLNHTWLDENISRLHVGTITDLGTAIGDAVVVAAKRLKAVPNSKSRIIILLTDGDNNMGKIDPLPAAQLAAAIGVKIYTIGIGIEATCNMPKFDPMTGNFILDASGNIIPTLLLQPANYTVLGKMADVSGGHFFRATSQRELQNIYNQIDRLEKSRAQQRRFATYDLLFWWPLFAALALLALELLLVNTRYRRVP
ncbi:MAG TPA: VWA domain-containing protein [Candidatus Sulfotelmatobacter sp.]|jgi:Ca-activated chloride channel family protein|nr:VWA domain-containing protein [Candidatus Sulfotelmatobacter sp.]